MKTIALLLAATCAVTISISVDAAAAETAYVTATSLNCRTEAHADSEIVAKLQQSTRVTVVDRESTWANIDLGEQFCWAAARYLSPEAIVAPYAFSGSAPTSASARARAGTSSSRPVAVRSSKPAKRSSTPRSSRSASGVYGASSCPCSGSRVCVGPRGGRFCITSGGNKRYGV
jgi:hypothetical protein